MMLMMMMMIDEDVEEEQKALELSEFPKTFIWDKFCLMCTTFYLELYKSA